MAIIKQPIKFDVGKFVIFLFICSTTECIVEVKKVKKPNQENYSNFDIAPVAMQYTLHSYTHHIWVYTPSLAYASPRLVDLGWALLVGVMAGLIGIFFKLIFGVVHLAFSRFNKRPVTRAILGGVIIGLIGSFLPLTLYSGQNQLLQIIYNPATYGFGLLLLMMLVKVLLTSRPLPQGLKAVQYSRYSSSVVPSFINSPNPSTFIPEVVWRLQPNISTLSL